MPNIPKDRKIYIGEAGGFQDYLWGFGMRYAMTSGYYAAKSIIEGKDFYQLCKDELLPKMKVSVVNRLLFKALNDKCYRLLMKYYVNRIKDPIEFMRKFYNPSLMKNLLFPLAKILLRKNIKDPRKI